MKIHGSIEARGAGGHVFRHNRRFHEWIFMALLKHSNSVPEGKVLCRFHEWIFMALLKHVYTIIFGNVLVDLFNI